LLSTRETVAVDTFASLAIWCTVTRINMRYILK
jgi:hypothetical protein